MMMMDNHSHHLTQQQLHNDDRRHNSPSSFIDNVEIYSPYSSDATMSPPTVMQQSMMCSQHEKAVNDNNYNGGALSSLQWSGGRRSSWDHPPPTNSHQQQQDDVPPAARITNDGQYSLDHQPMNCPPSETIATSNNSGNSSHIKSIPEKDRFLYTLFDILSSSSLDNNEESSIAWLSHGQGFSIVNKPMFESEILKRMLPNVKYASFVKRLKRYKFVR